MNKCVYCGGGNTTTHEEPETIKHGVGVEAIEIPYLALVNGCIDCGATWTDEHNENRITVVLAAHRRL